MDKVDSNQSFGDTSMSNSTSNAVVSYFDSLGSAELFDAVSAAQSLLKNFFQEDELGVVDFLSPVFGTNFDEIALASLGAQLRVGDFSSLPIIEARAAEKLPGANAIYLAKLDKIYVSSAFLETATSGELMTLLIENMGYAIDAAIKYA